MNGGDAVVETLIEHGVDTAFTVSGESFLPVLEALRRHRNTVRLVTTRHEGGAAFAAEAFGKLTGRPAAVFVSRGPGATNASIGVHTAKQDSTPLLLFIGHVPTGSKGRESFQEIDHHAMFGAVAKAVLEAQTADGLAATTAEAVRLSTEGRPGPVVVVLPRDLTAAEIAELSVPTAVKREPVTADQDTLNAAGALIDNAERPLAIVGEMVAFEGAQDQLGAFAEATGIPVMAAYRRQDCLANGHPAYAGHLEIDRVAFQREAMQTADLLLAIGSRLDGLTSQDRTWPKPHQKLVQIYPDEAVLARCAANVSVRSDCAPALAALTELCSAASEERQERQRLLHADYLSLSKPGSATVHGAVDLSEISAVVQRLVRPNAAIVTDGGSFARWIHRFYRFEAPATQAGPISGAMGYAVPGAIGAALAKPDAEIVAFVGDGGFLMTGQELTTAREQNIKLIIVLCDNNAHGSILQGQHRAYGADAEYGTVLQSPDFAAVARGYGLPAWTVAETAEFEPAFRAALAQPGPTLLHLLTDRRDIAPFEDAQNSV